MRVLFVSKYAEPNPFGSNNNVFRQLRALADLGVDVEVLTWPNPDTWPGPWPTVEPSGRFALLKWHCDDLNYHVVNLPNILLKRVLSEADWQLAVGIGCELLASIKPGIVHLQHWAGLWWILESAKRLAIPTVYTSHDWGLGCLRTILARGDGNLCDGVVHADKCVACIWEGRNPIGKANELLVSTRIGELAFEALERSALKPVLSRYGAVGMGLRRRVSLNLNRVKAILPSVRALVVPSTFARQFFQQLGVPANRIHVEPWYYDMAMPPRFETNVHDRVVMGYIGRISPEKGVKRIFDALLSSSLANPVHLVIAGAIEGEYAAGLHSAFGERVGKHTVEWMGWTPHCDIHKFFGKVDAVIVSSEGMDNTPLTLIESFAFRRPVIIPDMPSVRDLVQDGRTGYVTTFGSTASLAQAIGRASLNPGELLEMQKNIPPIKSSVVYANAIREIYEAIDVTSTSEVV